MTSESETTVFVCAYGRYKPGKVRQEFKFDGKIFLTGRQMTLVDDETKETYALTLIFDLMLLTCSFLFH